MAAADFTAVAHFAAARSGVEIFVARGAAEVGAAAVLATDMAGPAPITAGAIRRFTVTIRSRHMAAYACRFGFIATGIGWCDASGAADVCIA